MIELLASLVISTEDQITLNEKDKQMAFEICEYASLPESNDRGFNIIVNKLSSVYVEEGIETGIENHYQYAMLKTTKVLRLVNTKAREGGCDSILE
ncbi:hypothetical protein [Crocosphaera sp.]|uniref:hypothetical protein n=1 Tax=Crocosphaera sp. TaxID=2729996 RepID=UPI002628EB78|nr:hypothetical protein [Crocosphaera sp.]MDJ0579070.1 hypothetical protein [Crocosphaera sp.]